MPPVFRSAYRIMKALIILLTEGLVECNCSILFANHDNFLIFNKKFWGNFDIKNYMNEKYGYEASTPNIKE